LLDKLATGQREKTTAIFSVREPFPSREPVWTSWAFSLLSWRCDFLGPFCTRLLKRELRFGITPLRPLEGSFHLGKALLADKESISKGTKSVGKYTRSAHLPLLRKYHCNFVTLIVLYTPPGSLQPTKNQSMHESSS
jgi:hypothetical protein